MNNGIAYKDSKDRYRVFFGAACFICNKEQFNNLSKAYNIKIGGDND
jgi:hypothetical protein